MIINNQKIKGILYSRYIGALSAKGKCIFPLDNDDILLDNDVLTTITNIAKEGNFYIVEFKGIEKGWNYNSKFVSKLRDTNYAKNKLNLVLFQPELSTFPIKPGKTLNSYEIISCYLWAKCIKTDIYKKGLNSIDEEKYKRFMIAWEDLIAMIFLFNSAKSYKFVGKYGILHIKRFGSGYGLTKPIQMKLVNLYLTDITLDFPKNTSEYSKLIFNLVYMSLNQNILKEILKKNRKSKKVLFSCLDRFLNLDFIPNEYKQKILNKIKNLKFLDYHNFNDANKILTNFFLNNFQHLLINYIFI